MTTLSGPLAQVAALVTRFEANETSYKSPTYNETQVRREFLDEFFAALGWDVMNRAGKAEGFKDVIHEDRLRIKKSVKAPDYCFTLAGDRKFFVEAKKPAVSIDKAQAPAYQLRRYAWSAKMPLSILTDFEHLAIYDCRVRPMQGDKATVARTHLFHYKDFVAKWDEIVELFSRDAVVGGSIERHAAKAKKKRGTAQVDQAFLGEIEVWREKLAKAITASNPGLSIPELNYAITRIIDRIVFLRICEDRGIEPYGQLRSVLDRRKRSAYAELLDVFQRADDKYNSGLFHFKDEKGRPETADTLTPRLTIPDDALRSIVSNLYFPESPYEFSVLPTETLGNVYEQFIGRVIRFDSTSGIVIEEKPEVAKSGGITYTPTFIVDEIVPHVLDPLLKGKSPAEVEKLHVLDPACGSGTFLLGAYQHLLDWHLATYLASGSTKYKSRMYETAEGESRLTVPERKRILLNNIYGVDIDAQAVEVAKLSLLLKVLEGESEASTDPIALFHERALPDLGANVKSGNSLIGYDVLAGEAFDDETKGRINPFDWDREFPDVMQDGGFDGIVGNPPYVRIQTMTEYAPVEVEYFKKSYASAREGNLDIYAVFVERSLELLNGKGRLGFILPHKFFNAAYGKPLRAMLAKRNAVEAVVHFGHQQVFERRSTYTCLLYLTKQPNKEIHFEEVGDLISWSAVGATTLSGPMPAAMLSSDDWRFIVGDEAKLYTRLAAEKKKLSNVTNRTFQGIKTGADKVYIVGKVAEPSGSTTRIHSPETGREHLVETALLHRLYKGGDVSAYHDEPVSRLILFPYRPDATGKTVLIPKDAMQREFPFAWDYLSTAKSVLEARERGKWKGPAWYGYSRNQALEVMGRPKIFCRELSPDAAYVYDAEGELFFTGGVSGGYGIVPDGVPPKYLLALLNSTLLDWFVKRTGTAMRGGYYSFEARFINGTPIRVANAAIRKPIEDLVDRVHALHAQRVAAATPSDRQRIEREIEAVRGEIDNRVYAIFEVTPGERNAVEAAKF